MIYHGREGSLEDLDKTVRKTTKDLRAHIDEFDSIIVRGVSGLLVGSPVSLRLKKPLVIVRKHDESTHGYKGGLINADKLNMRVLFLDDFTSMGETKKRVIAAMKNKRSKIVACYYYRNEWKEDGWYDAAIK